MPQFKKGDRVQWQEGGWGQRICTGTVICEDRHTNGSNPFGFYVIRVDSQHYLAACHTAREMSSQTVSRSIDINKLALVEASHA